MEAAIVRARQVRVRTTAASMCRSQRAVRLCAIIGGGNETRELRNLRRYARVLQAERLHELRFTDALQQVLDLSAFSMDLMVSFSSLDELIRLQNSSLSVSVRKSNAKTLPARRTS